MLIKLPEGNEMVVLMGVSDQQTGYTYGVIGI